MQLVHPSITLISILLLQHNGLLGSFLQVLIFCNTSQIKSKGVTMTALLAKATALALVKHPVVNSSCRDGKSFTYNSQINIAVAVAIDGGLITPVLQDADKV